MIWFVQGFLALIAIQVFFLISHTAGAPWGVFAPRAGRGRASSAGAAMALIAMGLAFVTGLHGASFAAWGALALAALWFLNVALARDEGEQLLWRPVNGVMILCGLAALLTTDI